MNRIVTFGVAIAALSLPIVAISATKVVASVVGGYAIPDFVPNIRVANVYLDDLGHVVLGYTYPTADGLNAGFFDTFHQRRLTSNDETRIAHDSAYQKHLVERLRLTLQHPSLTLDTGGVKWTAMRLDGASCTWPYSASLEIERSGSTSEWMIFARLPVAEKRPYERDCEYIAGEKVLSTRYRTQTYFFYKLGNDGVFVKIQDRPYLIHFDDAGRSRFFAGRKDVVLVPTSEVQSIVAESDNSKKPQQSYIDDIEKRVAQRAAIQLEK